MPILYSEHGSHTNVAGVISLAKLTKSGRIPMPIPVRASAQFAKGMLFPAEISSP